MKKNRAKQPELFEAGPQRRFVSAEARDLYAAVVKLRTFGARVWRAGKLHKVNGSLLSDQELKARAAALRWR